MTRYAIGLRGKSHEYQKVANNVKDHVLDALQDNDLYIRTYHHSTFNEMIELYKPYKYEVVENTENVRIFNIVCTHIIGLLTMIQQSNQQYDWIILSRLDATFDTSVLSLFPLDPTKIHCLCSCEREPLIDDNLLIFTYDKIPNMIAAFQEILSKNLMTHDFKTVYEEITKQTNTISFLFPGKHFISYNRPFMKFAREIRK